LRFFYKIFIKKMGNLTELIDKLEQGILSGANYIKTINNPSLLVKTLKELRDVIGNDKVKDSIAAQISHLIIAKRRAAENPDIPEDKDVMLNTVLYGPPGVGKTLIGSKLAKIWSALGYLQPETPNLNAQGNIVPGKSNTNTGLTSMVKDLFSSSSSTQEENNLTSIFIIAVFIIVFISIISLLWSFYAYFGAYWTMMIVFILLLFIIIVSYYVINAVNSANPITMMGNNNNILMGNKVENDDHYLRIVTRADFVDRYVGGTDKKTLNLLKSCRGKVLFIDEAYSLLNGYHDEFGMEALTTLNLYLSQHPEQMVIMAGYKDLLETGIFTAQPGLPRRFMWHFDCIGYDSKELSDIFIFQANESGWDFENRKEISEVIYDNYEKFPAFGGDTKKLLFYAKLEHSNEYMINSKNMSINKLSTEHVKKGILKLKDNNINNESSSDGMQPMNPLAQMMKMFQKQ